MEEYKVLVFILLSGKGIKNGSGVTDDIVIDIEECKLCLLFVLWDVFFGVCNYL